MEKKSTRIAYFVALGIFIVLLVILGISYKDAPILIEDATTPFAGTFWSLLPPIVAIVLALISKEVYSSLFLGCLVGALLVSNYKPWETLVQLVEGDNGIVTTVSDAGNIAIIVFLVVLGIMVDLMNKTGGSEAFGRWATKTVHTRAGAQLMTMLLVAEALDTGKIKLTDTVTGSANAASKGGSQIWLEVGEQMTVEELLKAVVIASANDACTALAEFVAGSDGAFVQCMNDRAKELGLQDTHFENCTGLDDTAKNHFSSAYDLAVIAREVLRHNWITKYATVWLDSLRDGKTELNNTNKLVNTYDGITGLKTGTTEKAGFCLCATARRDGMQLIAVVLGAKTSEQRFSAATALLDSGFANYRLVTLSADPKKITQITVKNGVQKILNPAVPAKQQLLCAKGSGDPTYEYKLKKTVDAPVRKNTRVGTVKVKLDGKTVAELPVYAGVNIDKTAFWSVFVRFLRTF